VIADAQLNDETTCTEAAGLRTR